MLGGQNTRARGYTIVEVMIFLAVSGLMFVVAAIFVSGKQAQVEFRQGMQNINAKIQNVVNEVANGEYPSLGSYSCTVTSDTNPGSNPTFTPTAKAQGTNGDNNAGTGTSGCIFFGKVIQLNVNGQASNYSVYSLAARQFNATHQVVQSFSEARPHVIQQNSSPVFDTTEIDSLQNGLTISGVYSCTTTSCDTANKIGAFGFFGSFNAGANASDIQSGSQTVTTAVIPGTVYGNDELTTIGKINGSTGPGAGGITASNEILGGNYLLLCFDSGRGRKGSLQIGGNSGQQFTTTLSYTGAGCP